MTVWSSGDSLSPSLLNSRIPSWASTLPVYDVVQWGAVVDGITDDSPSWTAAITAATAAKGGRVRLSRGGTSVISSTLTVSQGNVFLEGIGSGFNTDIGSLNSGAQLSWTGATGGTMVVFTPTVGATAQALKRGGMAGLSLRANNVADTALLVQSMHGGHFTDLYIDNARAVAFDLSCVTQLGENRDVTQCFFDTINIRQVSGSSSSAAVCMRLDGDGTTTANVNNNDFIDISVLHFNGVAYRFNNSDCNRFWSLKAYNAAGGSGSTGIVLSGGTSDALACRANLFGWVSAGSRGLTAFANTRDNNILHYSQENGEPAPTIAAGASLQWSGQSGNQYMPSGSSTKPVYAFSSENSLGFYRSTTSTVDLSYGTLQVPTLHVTSVLSVTGNIFGNGTIQNVGGGFRATGGTAVAPSFRFSSEDSLGWYNSAGSTMALSYGTLNLRGAALSLRTTNSSGNSSAVTNGELVIVAMSTTSCQLALRSGNTTYLFNAVGTAL